MAEHEKQQVRVPIWVMTIGFAFGIVLSNRIRENATLQDSVSGVGGMVTLLLVINATLGGFILYAQASFDRRLFGIAAVTAGGASSLVLVPAHHFEWLRGTAFDPPLLVQIVVYGFAMVGWCTLFLAVYRQVRKRSVGLALVVYAVGVVVFSIAGAATVRRFEDSGTYVIGHGYSVAWDTAWGAAMFLTALAVYEAARAVTARRPVA